MKRIKIITLLLAVILLTGCSNNLKCEIKTNNYNSTIKTKFSKDKPVKYTYSDEMLFSDNSNTDSEIYYHTKYEKYSALINEKYAKVRSFQNKVSVKVNYNFSKNKSQNESALIIKRNDTIKSARKKIESLGYKCK